MIVTIIAEPRSGSNNFANWFNLQKDFTVFYEPFNVVSKWYQNNKPPKEYKFYTKNLCIKEIFYPNKSFDTLIEVSDKIICLYRENYQDQLESFLNSVTTNNWSLPYVYKPKESNIIKEKTQYFSLLKKEFREKYLCENFFKISYEELYYKKGIVEVINYLNNIEIESLEFPIGQKYRKFIDEKKTII